MDVTVAVVAAVVVQILALHLLVTLPHEFGHLIAARLAGVDVPEFGIGLPPRIVAVRWRGTRWSLNALPLGAFVGYNSSQIRSSIVRSFIAIGGPLGNFAVALACLGICLIPIWPSEPSTFFVGMTLPELAGALSHWMSVSEFLHLLASASITIGLFNLLPLPTFDGRKVIAGLIGPVHGSPLWQRAGRAVVVGGSFLAFGSLLVVTAYA